ncbi:hypothetical protein AB0878_44815 [Amycolatopsis sp. NPDC047767]|uniref:hypothetical protein n=1 Tax=Amycolatopsis sp. NPDC047767 TaxID=3156765 RepID=UPI003456230E
MISSKNDIGMDMNRTAIAATSGALGVVALIGAFAGGYFVGRGTNQPTTTLSAPLVAIYTCTHDAVSAPSSYVLTCADANSQLQGLRWSGWGSPTAHASGVLSQNDCIPDCADGHFVQFPASVTVTGLEGLAYTWLSVKAPQAPGGPYDFTLTSNGPS